ncbi:hypothetical protein ACN47E_007418 [Coniothyrium glycines]
MGGTGDDAVKGVPLNTFNWADDVENNDNAKAGDAMDGVEGPDIVSSVIIKHDALDDRACKLIEDLNPLLYPDWLKIGFNQNNELYPSIDTKDLFSMRASDHNRAVMPAGLGKRALPKAIVLCGDLFAGKHMDTSFEAAKELDTPVEDGVKSPTSPKPSPPAEEVVNVVFHHDTQTPNIEFLTARKTLVNGKPVERVISARIFARNIMWGDGSDGRVFFNAEKYKPDDTVDRTQPRDVPTNGSRQLIENMSQTFEKTCVVKVTIKLTKGIELWNGHVPDTYGTIETTGELPTATVHPSDNLIRMLKQTDHPIEIFFTCRQNEGALKKWSRFSKYTRDLLTIAKYYGNFWFYSWQCLDNDLPSRAAFTDLVLPNLRWTVPRWLVEEWQFVKTTTQDGIVTFSKPTPYKYKPLDFPSYGFEDADEAAFLLKMGVRDDFLRQSRDLKELVQSDGDKWFRGRFRSLDAKKRTYVVEVYLGLDAEMAEKNLSMPRPGTRIHLEVDQLNTSRPTKKNIIELDGVVVYDALETGASFICVVNVKGKNLHIADNELEYQMFISYLVDDTPAQRMYNGIGLLQAGFRKTTGPDSRHSILNCRAAAHNESVLKKEIPKKAMTQFRKYCDEIGHPANPKQMMAAVRTCLSDSGNVVIVGPPGTGKTEVILKTGHAHGRSGRRVMYTAPMNSNVHVLLNKFLQANAGLLEDKQFKEHEWVFFNGGHAKMAKADLLRKKQEGDGNAIMQLADNKLMAYLRDAEVRARIPHHKYTLGYKLARQIEIWAADPKYDEEPYNKLHTRAKDYKDTAGQINFLTNKDQKTRARSHLVSLEYNLSREFLNGVKFLFCTLSSTGHELVHESGDWDVLIIDEAAGDTRASIAVALGGLLERLKLIVWAGDHYQGKGIVLSKDSNIGYNLLSRNVFANLVDNKKTNPAAPCETIMLTTCYRMPQKLIDWSSHWCYEDSVKAHPSTTEQDTQLRNMLSYFWKQRVADDFQGDVMQIGLDVTDLNAKDEFLHGTTTRLNRVEANVVAMSVISMLVSEPPKDTASTSYRRIRGSDICIISNFTGQILQLQRAMKEMVKISKMKPKQADLDDLWFCTTTDVQGKERNITFYSTVIAPGKLRLETKAHIPIGFVADIKNLNVSVTRCKIARYTVGALQLFVQAWEDRHLVTRNPKHRSFFGFINDLRDRHSIVTYADCMAIFKEGVKQSSGSAFKKLLKQPASFSRQAGAKEPRNVDSPVPESSKAKFSGKNKFKAAPTTANFAGDRNEDGVLRVQNPGNIKKKKRGGKGGTKKHRNNPDGPDAGAGASAASTAPTA